MDAKTHVPYTCPLRLILLIPCVLLPPKINNLRAFNPSGDSDPHRPYQN
jgi:hypothetical protein